MPPELHLTWFAVPLVLAARRSVWQRDDLARGVPRTGRDRPSATTPHEGWAIYAIAHFLTVPHVRVVRLVPNIFSMSVMNTGPRALGT